MQAITDFITKFEALIVSIVNAVKALLVDLGEWEAIEKELAGLEDLNA